MRRLILSLFAAGAMVGLAITAGADPQQPQIKPKQKKGDGNPNTAQPPAPPKGKPIPATDPAAMKVMKDFKVELLYSVPKDTEGSWVNLCHDPKGRLVITNGSSSLLFSRAPA